MFAAPPVLQTEIWSRLPDALRLSRETQWSRWRGGGAIHSFLEGPSFDRAGNLFVVDACGRIFRISPSGDWTVFADYDGCPNGLKIHRDGRIFVTDQMHGVLWFDPASGQRHVALERAGRDRFHGVNDLVFADNGDLYFTDPGASDLQSPTGRVYCLRTSGEVDLIADGLPYPNGLVLTPSQEHLLLAVTRSQQVQRILLKPDYRKLFRRNLFLQMQGGPAGPDGMAIDEEGNLAVAHAGFGAVWRFSAMGEPVTRLNTAAGPGTTNVAYGGVDRKDLFITESHDGVILRARLPVAGRAMYSHR